MKMTQEQFDALERWVMSVARYAISTSDDQDHMSDRMDYARQAAHNLLVETEEAVTFGDGRTHDWRRCPCASCMAYRDAQV